MTRMFPSHFHRQPLKRSQRKSTHLIGLFPNFRPTVGREYLRRERHYETMIIRTFLSRRRLVTGLLALGLSAGAAFGKSPVDPVNHNSGVAIQGYDPVAYFQQSRPVKGAPQFSHTWMGATWQFSSAANRDLFQANPQQYTPQFGGYCAWAVSNGYTAKIDPEAWKIVGGKLYLNYSKDVQKMWEKEIDKRIEAGNRNWPGLHK